MAKYFVMLRMKHQSDYTFTTGESQYNAVICEYDGDLVNATDHFTKIALYLGDGHAKPEEYKAFTENSHDYDEVVVVPLHGMDFGHRVLANEIEGHNKIVSRRDEKLQKGKDLKELARLKEKYEEK